jgi:hypothetical protein
VSGEVKKRVPRVTRSFSLGLPSREREKNECERKGKRDEENKSSKKTAK